MLQYVTFQNESLEVLKNAKWLREELKHSLERFQQHHNIRRYQAEVNSHFAHHDTKMALINDKTHFRFKHIATFIHRLKNYFDQISDNAVLKKVTRSFSYSFEPKIKTSEKTAKYKHEFNTFLNKVKTITTSFKHAKPLDTAKQLGYQTDLTGVCFGYTSRWLEACALHQEDKFNERIAFIAKILWVLRFELSNHFKGYAHGKRG